MTQSAISTILPAIPAARPAPAVVYFPQIFKADGWIGFPELARSDQTKATIVADLASAQHEDVRRVLAFDLSTGVGWDASKEIAQAVLDVVLVDHARVPTPCIEFLEEQLGIDRVQNAIYERWAA